MYEKKIDILLTNVIGFQIGAYGYLELHISLYQDPVNPHKKIPKVVAGVGEKESSDYSKLLCFQIS